MRPKTKLQIELSKVNKRIKRIGKRMEIAIGNKMFDHYAYRTTKTETCLTCNTTWKASGKEVCPKCKSKLTYLEGRKRTARDVTYASIIEVFEGYQIIRYFHCYFRVKLGEKATDKYWINEVVRHIIKPDGSHNVFSVRINGLNKYNYTDGWILSDKDLEIRNINNNHYINPERKFCDNEFIPEIYRNGYDGDTHGMNEAYYTILLLTVPAAETLLKAKQISLFEFFTHGKTKIFDHWKSIKICLRNNYNVSDAGIWFDYIDLLKHFKYDIQNSKYICPKDLKYEHNKLLSRKRKQDEAIYARQRRENELKEIAKRKNDILVRKLYSKRVKRFDKVEIKKGNISIVPLKTIKDFKLEEKALDHCVYTSAYYAKVNSLILSARIDDIRTETIEFDLKQMGVIQCRGFDNNNTKYHNDILNLINKNIKVIKKANELCQRK